MSESPRYIESKNQYMSRNSESLNQNDEKLIAAIYNLKKNYTKSLEDRKCTKLIDISEIKTKVNIEPKISKEKPQKKTCKAIKMDGNQCAAAAKENCDFCGRHLPKISS